MFYCNLNPKIFVKNIYRFLNYKLVELKNKNRFFKRLCNISGSRVFFYVDRVKKMAAHPSSINDIRSRFKNYRVLIR